MHVLVYTKSDCISCTKAKMLLASKNISYQELKLNEDFTRETLLEQFPSAASFPIIVIDGFNIGGVEQLSKMINEQKEPIGKFLTEG